MTKNLVFNKQIILAAGMIVFVVAALIGGTGAFFSDTESSTGNVFTAGAVNIAITDITHTPSEPNLVGFELDDEAFTFSFDDLKPLDKGTVTYTLENEDNPAFVCAMVEETGNADNGINDPEGDAGDATDGAGNGELGQFLNFKFGAQAGALSAISGVWQTVGTINTDSSAPAAIDYCFGTFSGSDCVLGSGTYNLAQTDSLTANVKFYAVQTRNNENFSCASLNAASIDNGDLFTLNDRPAAYGSKKWFFYNDSNDTIMSINQFAPNGENTIGAGPGGVGAAKMLLDSASSRYNIATYQFSDVKLADISSMKYRIYDASASSQTPYLNFNIDFNNSDTWQRRLVQVPTGVVANTWTEVDALAGMWTLSGGNWPVGVNTAVPFSGATARTWADILADYPLAETRSTDSFFGVRVGHPGPVAEESYVDWIEFDGVQYNFGG